MTIQPFMPGDKATWEQRDPAMFSAQPRIWWHNRQRQAV